MTPPPSTRPGRLPVAAALFAFTCLAFSPSLFNGFVRYDDADYLTENPVVQAGLGWPGVAWAFTTFHAANWHPLTWLSHMLDWELFGAHAWGHHLVGLLLHALTAALVFSWLDDATLDRPRSALVATLFAVHPLRVESVAWAAERKDLLCALFFVCACWVHVRRARAGQGPWPTVVLGALALASKPMAVTLPFALLLLDAWPLGRLKRGSPIAPLLVEKAPLLLLCGASAWITVIAQRAWGAVASLEVVPLWIRPANAAVNVARYLIHTVWPVGLVPFYPLEPGGPPLGWELGSLALVGVLTALAWRAFRSRPAILVGWLWFLGTLVPVLGLVQAGAQSVADRYTYLPHLGLLLAGAWAIPELRPGARRVAGAFAAAVALVLAGWSFWLTRFWSSPETLFTRVHALSPTNPVGNLALGVERLHAHRFPEAETLLRASLEQSPRLVSAIANLAFVVVAQGRLEEGLALYARAHALAPMDLDIAAAYARALERAGRIDPAAAQAEEVFARQPERRGAALQLGRLRGAQGRVAEALPLLERALAQDPGDPSAHATLGITLARLGRFEEAVRQFEASLALAPDQPDVRQLLRFASEDAARRGGPAPSPARAPEGSIRH